jgi:hypothetical protein
MQEARSGEQLTAACLHQLVAIGGNKEEEGTVEC